MVGSQAVPHRAPKARPRVQATAPRPSGVLNGSTPADTHGPCRGGVPSRARFHTPRCRPDRQLPSHGDEPTWTTIPTSADTRFTRSPGALRDAAALPLPRPGEKARLDAARVDDPNRDRAALRPWGRWSAQDPASCTPRPRAGAQAELVAATWRPPGLPPAREWRSSERSSSASPDAVVRITGPHRPAGTRRRTRHRAPRLACRPSPATPPQPSPPVVRTRGC